jgi:hypothetical protein
VTGGNRHGLHGLLVDSPVPLAAGPATAEGGPPDLVIAWRRGRLPAARGPVLARVDDAGRRSTLVSAGGSARLLLHDTLCADLHADGRVEVTAAAHVGEGLLAALLSGPVVAAAAVWRGHPLLHASAVCLPEGVIGFVGPTGAGKSTLARLLTAPGRRLFSDDALRLDAGGSGVVAHRGTTSSRLRDHVSDLDTLASGRAVAVSADGRWVVTDEATAPGRAELAGLVVPLLSPGYAEVRARPATPASALVALSSAPALAGMSDPALRRTHFDLAGAVASAVPVVLLEVPWLGARHPDLAADVLAALGAALRTREPVRG